MTLPRLNLGEFVHSLLRIVLGQPHIPPSLANNALLQVILRRRSVRHFSSRPIPDDVFAAILEAGRLAPSGVNLQTWTFAPFTADEWQSTFGRPIPFRGQRAILIMGDTHRAKSVLDVFPDSPLVEYTIAVMNASLAAMNMNLAAEALGVSSVMLSETGRSGFLDAAYLRETLRLPDGVTPLMTLVLGYASRPYPPMPPKLPLAEITFKGVYREADPVIMRDWLAQMIAGYKASHLDSSFQAQVQVYLYKIGQAEAELQRSLFAGRTRHAHNTTEPNLQDG